MIDELLPREKALTYGINSLSNIELIALVLKSAYKNNNVFNLAKELLDKADGFNNLLKLSYDELITIKGIKRAKALEIMAILEIAKRLCEVDSVKENNVLNPLVLVDYLRFNHGFKDQEEFVVIFLASSGKIIKSETLFKGKNDTTLVGINEIFRKALLLKAKAIVVSHNHPSGNVNPSRADISMTQQILEVSKLMDIELLDHLIICDNNYYSFKSNHLL